MKPTRRACGRVAVHQLDVVRPMLFWIVAILLVLVALPTFVFPYLVVLPHVRKWSRLMREGWAAWDADDLDTAASRFEQAVQEADLAGLVYQPKLYWALRDLAEVRAARGEPAKAAAAYQQALPIAEKMLGPRHPDVAALLNELAELRLDQDEPAAAELHGRRALAILDRRRRAMPDDLARTLQTLAVARYRQRDFAESEALLRRRLAVVENAFGSESLELEASWDDLLTVFEAQGKSVSEVSKSRH